MFSCLGGFHYIILVYFPLHNVALNIEAVLQAASFQRQNFLHLGFCKVPSNLTHCPTMERDVGLMQQKSQELCVGMAVCRQ